VDIVHTVDVVYDVFVIVVDVVNIVNGRASMTIQRVSSARGPWEDWITFDPVTLDVCHTVDVDYIVNDEERG
jgi:hypothetical protein